MRIDSGFVEPFDFAAVGARQPTSRARVLEVRIQSPPAESPANLSCRATDTTSIPRPLKLTTPSVDFSDRRGRGSSSA
jgi:hypothetical protein